MQYSNRALIALLRTPSELRTTDTAKDRDDLAPARGVIIGLLLVVPFWVAVGLLVWFLLGR